MFYLLIFFTHTREHKREKKKKKTPEKDLKIHGGSKIIKLSLFVQLIILLNFQFIIYMYL